MPLEKDALDDLIIRMSFETGSTIRIKITGLSMWPLVGSGAMLGIRPDRREIKKGDIILFRLSERMIAHRVINTSPNIFTTKGDASIFFDPHVQLRDIIGRAVFIENGGRRTNIDTGIWRLLNCILAYYSCACGIMFGRVPKGCTTAPSHRPARISSAINLLLSMFIYILTRRL